jgi:hypothetical protein
MNSNLHVLGKYRYLIIWILTLVLMIVFSHGYISGHSDAKSLRISNEWEVITLIGLGSLATAFLTTTEPILRLIISIVSASLASTSITSITSILITVFSQEPPSEGIAIWIYMGSLFIGFIVCLIVHDYLDRSSWIGTRCLRCQTRGSLRHVQIDRKFLRTDTTSFIADDQTISTTFDVYLITTKHSCLSCKYSWKTQSEGS